MNEYIVRLFKYLVLIAIACVCVSWLDDCLFSVSIHSYGDWCLYALQLLVLYSVSCLLFVFGETRQLVLAQ